MMKVRFLLLSSWSFLFFCLNVMMQKKFFFKNACLFTYNLVSFLYKTKMISLA